MGEWIEIELVEEPNRQRRIAAEPALPKPPRAPRLEGRNRRMVGIGAGVAVVVGIGWAVAQSGGDVTTSAPPATPEESVASTPEPVAVDTTQPEPPTSRVRTPTTTVPPIAVEELGGPLLPSPTGVTLVGLTVAGDLLDIDLDSGQMTTTDLPGGSSGSPATILAGEAWTHLQRWDMNQAMLVPRGEPPVDITSMGQMFGGLFRGPDPDTVWVMQSDPNSGSVTGMSLVGLDGEDLGRSMDLRGWWPMQSDLAGGVIVQAGGGIYTVSEAGARRVADGELVGVGVNHFLVRACDEALACGLYVVDRASGDRRQVPVIQVDGLAQYYGWMGTDTASVSPDGTAAILFGLDGGGQTASLLGTDTGVYQALTRLADTFSIAWSDDSRYVVYTESRELKAFDRQSGDEIMLSDAVPALANFAARP